MKVSQDQKYLSYVQIFAQLDGLMWRMPTLLGGGITLIFTISLGSEGEAPPISWVIILVFAAATTLLGAYGMHRIRVHQKLIGDALRDMETDGYFHKRKSLGSTGWAPSIPSLYISFFVFVSFLFGCAAYLILAGNEAVLQMFELNPI